VRGFLWLSALSVRSGLPLNLNILVYLINFDDVLALHLRVKSNS
jgi:hypothetical protein